MFAFQAGNDILLSPDKIDAAVKKIKKLLKKQKEYNDQLNNTVKKILATKYDAGLNKKSIVKTNGLVDQLNLTIAPYLFGGAKAPTLTGLSKEFLGASATMSAG